jgi:CheY-like chemotaxis protein
METENTIKILLVDDEVKFLKAVSERLSIKGFDVTTADNGDDAVAAARKGGFDVDVVDMQMPGIDGDELGRQIKDDTSMDGTILIMLTSIGDRRTARIEEIGFSAYLTKPIKASQLYGCLTAVLETPDKPASQAKPITTKYSIPHQEAKACRVLLVEDNPVNQVVAMHLLTDLGHRADIAANGAEAVTALVSTPYDVVLMDIQMPEMDGFEATGIIRDPSSPVLNHDVPIIAMTAHAMKGDRERCKDGGMDGYLSKPVDRKELDLAIRRHTSGAARTGGAASRAE